MIKAKLASIPIKQKVPYGSRYSRMDQVKSVEDRL